MAKKRDAEAFSKAVVAELHARDPRRVGITVHGESIAVEIAPRPRPGLRSSPRYALTVYPFVRWAAELRRNGQFESEFDGPAVSASLNTVANWIEKLVDDVDAMTDPKP